MKTYLPKEDAIPRQWWVVDAEGQVLGRMAVKIANILRGKNKPTYTPHLDVGDFVIVLNAEKVKLTGKKNTDKVYKSYSGYMGGLKEVTADRVRARKPTRLVAEAVWGMLPKGRLARKQFRKLKLFAGTAHPHAAQNPQPLKLD
ncbi:MAG: 50S ribosomal protein L13 [Lentisphaeria bacterium]